MKSNHFGLLAFTVVSLFCFRTGHTADESFFHVLDSAGGGRMPWIEDQKTEAGFFAANPPVPAGIARPDELHRDGTGKGSTIGRLKRAETLSLSAQIAGMGILQAADAWNTGHRPFPDAGANLRRAWTTAPAWDADSYVYNYIGHPYTGAFTYNLMRSQEASPVASWLFSCSQSLIWEYSLEAMEQQPSIQDLLFTSNIGSLMGEGIHRLTGKLKKNGLSRKEKILILILNPAHFLNNGFSSE